jgi:hypothetical protein
MTFDGVKKVSAGPRVKAQTSSPWASVTASLRNVAFSPASMTRTSSSRGVLSVARRSKDRHATGSSGLICVK